METNIIYNMDCIEGMQKLKDGSVNSVITDPPFGIDFTSHRANYHRSDCNVIQGYDDVLVKDYEEFTRDWMTQAYRVLSDDGSMFIFSGWNNLVDILLVARELGLTTVNHIIWKYQFGLVTTKKFVSSHYHVLYLCKNDKKRKFYPWCRFARGDKGVSGESLHYKDKEDVWVIKREYWTNKQKTPTKLPREIIEKIISYTTDCGDLILDPFLGSGQVAVVSNLMDRKYVGFEIIPEYFEFAKNRLDSGVYLP